LFPGQGGPALQAIRDAAKDAAERVTDRFAQRRAEPSLRRKKAGGPDRRR